MHAAQLYHLGHLIVGIAEVLLIAFIGYQLKPGQPTVQGFRPTAVEADRGGEEVPRYVGSPFLPPALSTCISKLNYVKARFGVR